MRIDAPSAARPARLPFIDAARGVAVLAMVVYHFSWDLRYFGYITADVAEGPGWRLFARAIAGSFLFIVGIGLYLSTRSGWNWRRYVRRLGVIVAAALAITIVTWFVFRDSFIFFGILHLIAVASVLAIPFVRAPVSIVLAAAVICFAAPALLAGPAFDHPALLWLGLASYFPRTNDFVPLFPWFGVVLLGIAAAQLAPRFATIPPPMPRWLVEPHWTLLWAGRHSLGIYLLHQPILFGLVWLATQMAPPDLRSFEASYLGFCETACVESGVDAELCRASCVCLAERSQAEGLWDGLLRQNLDAEGEARYFTLADQCREEAARSPGT
jgi:uncharacterized membrane protein